jgi:pyridoxine 5'-phosphate synthase PdxJ
LKVDDLNALQASVESSAKVIAPDMNIPMDYLANSLKIAAANVPEVATLKPEDLVDVSLLQEIKASGFIDKLYQS